MCKTLIKEITTLYNIHFEDRKEMNIMTHTSTHQKYKYT